VPEAAERAIVVSGEASVRRAPDNAIVSLSVTVRGARPARARDAANQHASAVLAALRELGIPEADVQAASLIVQPTHDYASGTPKLVGYDASRPITVRLRDLELLGPVLDQIVDDGATQVQGTVMQLADPEEASREALSVAYAAAAARAQALASAAGLTLGEPIRIEEESGWVPFRGQDMAMMRGAVGESAATEVAAGEIEIGARVRAWFSLA
jgi:uncharacterized protein YggE